MYNENEKHESLNALETEEGHGQERPVKMEQEEQEVNAKEHRQEENRLEGNGASETESGQADRVNINEQSQNNSSYSGSVMGSGSPQDNSSYHLGQIQNSSHGAGQSQTSGYSVGQSQNSSYGTGQPQTSGYGSGQPQTSGYGMGQPQTSGYGAGQPQNGSYGSGQMNGYGRPQNSYGSGGNSYGNYGNANTHSYGDYAPWQQPSDNHASRRQARPKKPMHPLVKKGAGIVAAALLFGVVAGGTISGIQLLTRQFAPELTSEKVTVSQVETLPQAETKAQENGAVTALPTVMNDVSAIVERAIPSVVAINSVTQREVQNWFGQSQIYEGKGSGSGIIVGESDTELLIVTNNHVIEGATTLSVIFNDNEEVEAHIKGTDSENDLAVLAVNLESIEDSTKSKIAVATLGDSDSLKVGQGVIAIGNALGYGQSVTVGYVSALNREVHTDEQTTRNLLQTDAAINPGNSGGALLNMQGEVVGINSAKYSSTDVEGMGYAIPISKVHDIIDDLMTKKTRVQVEQSKQGYLGIQGTDIDSNASNLYGMPQGIYVYKIIEDGAAANSDLKEKDIITKFDGQSVRSMAELKTMLLYYAGGDTIELTVQSLQDGQYVERKVSIVLGTRPADESIQ